VRLQRLAARGIRNLEPLALDVDAPMVVFHGRNGQGKTNVLEAIGLLGALRSFRTSHPAHLLGPGHSEAMVQGRSVGETLSRDHRLVLSPAGRRLQREDRAVDSETWLRGLRAAWFVPSDTGPLRGEPAARRQMLDRAVLNVDPGYLAPSRALRRLLEQKAAALRADRVDAQVLDALDAQLAGVAAEVTAARGALVAGVRGRFVEGYRDLAGAETPGVDYRPALAGDAEAWKRQLEGARSREIAARRVLASPARDDLEFTLGGLPAKTHASQGQARSLVLAWKLAELHAATEAAGEPPLFLLDDLGSELDADRSTRLVSQLSRLGAQVFVTTTDARAVPDPGGAARRFSVEAGRVSPG
jgi:DNA replication and repair protein RecF